MDEKKIAELKAKFQDLLDMFVSVFSALKDAVKMLNDAINAGRDADETL